MNPKSKVINPKGAVVNKIMNAAETCPTKAIIVENKDSKRRLYPL
jgi:ferredoxin